MIKTASIHLLGTGPLLMHNAQLSDEFNPYTKAIKALTSKGTRQTEDDRWEKRRLEYLGSMYFDAKIGPYIPGQNIQRSLVDAARITRAGKTIERGVVINGLMIPLSYTGPRDPEVMFKDENFVNSASVKVQTSRITRVRPMFKEWELTTELSYDTDIIDLESLTDIAARAGASIGLGDWRPRFGRFEATVTNLE